MSSRPIRPIDRVQAATLTLRYEGGEGRPLRAVIAGEVDFASAPTMQTGIAAALESDGASALIMDLSAVQFMDSSGLRGLVEIQRELTDADGRMVLLDPTPQVRRILTLTGLDRHLQVVDTVDQAERLLDTGAGQGPQEGQSL